jgi:hypothetical protein
MPLGGQHLLQLAAAGHQPRYGPRRSIRQRSHFGLDRLAKVRQDGCVQPVGLGQLAGRTCETAHLARIDDDHRQLLGAERRGRADLETTSGLGHDALGRQRDTAVDQLANARGVIAHRPARSTRTHRHIQLSIADIGLPSARCILSRARAYLPGARPRTRHPRHW